MYENIGEKIKNWAKWIFIVEAIAAIVGGLALMFEDAAFVGAIIIIVGPLVAWVSTWLLYAFGELVAKTVANERHTKAILEIIESKEKPEIKVATLTPRPATPRPAVHAWRCDGCGKMATQSPCEHCGK